MPGFDELLMKYFLLNMAWLSNFFVDLFETVNSKQLFKNILMTQKTISLFAHPLNHTEWLNIGQINLKCPKKNLLQHNCGG